MKKKILFRGCATALVTPFLNGEIDFSTLDKLIERQLQAGIPALVIGGTTAEVATLSDEERYALYRHAIETVRGRTSVILGTGTNDTRIAQKHTRLAEELGADGVLVVTPYYNKGTQDGIVQHYIKIAEATTLPVMLYNVPSRTGVNLKLSQLEELAKIENIVAVKEATDSLDRLVEISAFGDALHLYSGNDTQIYPTLALGGLGVISVASNLLPDRVEGICRHFFKGNCNEALKEQHALLPFFHAMFTETNPAPIKYALSRKGLCQEELRLPLAPPPVEIKNQIDRVLADIPL